MHNDIYKLVIFDISVWLFHFSSGRVGRAGGWWSTQSRCNGDYIRIFTYENINRIYARTFLSLKDQTVKLDSKCQEKKT